ncbi:hypothetical protein HMI54_012925 [Coelomomyces lativittatus]|nr:hypothetical protein HMI54_012925 [Coelomomyces lativittatus]
MKNIVLLLASGIFTIIYGNAYAQKLENISSASISQLNKNNPGHPVMRNQVPTRAYRHFMKAYAGVKEEIWHQDKSDLVAMFYTDGMPQMSFYDRKGNWVSSVLNYGQAKLPKKTFELVNKTFNIPSFISLAFVAPKPSTTTPIFVHRKTYTFLEGTYRSKQPEPSPPPPCP